MGDSGNSEVSVCTEVAERGLCIGCGSCAAFCPRQRLDIRMNDLGCYEVQATDKPCSPGCSVCLRVCPFGSGNADENELGHSLFGQDSGTNHRAELGFYKSCFVGYSQRGEQRLSGASGGLATWFLTELLRRGDVDHVVCVTRDGVSRDFNFVVCDTPEQVENCSKSAYCPVEMSDAIRTLKQIEGKFAIACLPCFAKSLRLASAVLPDIRNRLVAIVGLVCGHSASSFFGDYCAELLDSSAGRPSSVVFRTKNPSKPAHELGIECAWGSRRRTIYWSQGPGEAWYWQWFTPNACLYCDDVFAETADIAFMDAWLPEYHGDYRGTNLIVTRSELADAVMNSGAASGDIHLAVIDPAEIVRSQEHVVQNKTRGLAHRLWLRKHAGQFVPVKRVVPARDSNAALRQKWWRQLKSAEKGCKEWRGRRSIATFRRRMSSEPPTQRLRALARKAKSLVLRLTRL